MASTETTLYQPVKEFLERQGFSVRGEVHSCDLVAARDDRLVIVELKLRFNLELVLQALERQKLVGDVYVAIPPPRKQNRRWAQIKRLCARLGIGLLTVNKQTVTVISSPEYRTPQGKRRKQLIREFGSRSGDYNTGGSCKRPVVTGYREDALRIAAQLTQQPKKLRELVQETGVERAGRIMQDNHYGWFERVQRGVYRLTAAGNSALEQYAEVVQTHQNAE